MTTQLARGVRLLEESPGNGKAASRGDRVVFNLRLYLHRRDEVPLNGQQAASLRAHGLVRDTPEGPLIDHRIRLGARQAIAGVERALTGMQAGSYRRVEIAPHLAYGDTGLPGLIPPDALLEAEIWLREVIEAL